MRAATPAGVRLGAYGWIEGLRRDTTTTPPTTGDAFWTGTSDGYVHAPSLQHAATAAVLRSAYLSHQDPTQQPSAPATNSVLAAQQEPFAVDLSSKRMRLAEWLIGGIRAGQSLSAMLGYRAERLLTETGDPTGVIALRQQFPAPGSPPADGSQAAVSTIDGLAFMKAQLGLATAGTASAAAPEPGSDSLLYDVALDLQEILDAAGDLLLAESVHQLVGGNPARASVAADALGSAAVVPDRFDVLRTPRSGVAQRHRVGWIASAGAAAVGGWPLGSPRSQFNPQADCWAGTILGPVESWSLTATRADGTSISVTLAELGVGPLDVVFEATPDPVHSVLAGRLAEKSGGPFTAIAGYDELAAIAARLRACLSAARALTPADLGVGDVDPTAGVDLADLRARVSGLLGYQGSSIRSLESAQTSDAQFAALAALSLTGTPGAFPLSHDADVLAAQRDAVLARPAPVDPGEPPADPTAVAAWLAAVNEVVQSIDPTIPFITTFVIQSGSDAANAFATPPPDATTEATMDWMAGVGRVRPSVQGLHDALLASEVHNGPLSLQVLQTPAASGAGWIALAQDNPTGRASAVLHAPATPSPTQAMCGMVVDEWVEVVPGHASLATDEPSEVTGVSFHYGAPDARAPQAVLLAVPADPAQDWTANTLLQVVREVLDLAKMRGADLGDVPGLGCFLPTTRLRGAAPFADDRSAETFNCPTSS
jgi:hypothetical protein